jgi:hypothetical protein
LTERPEQGNEGIKKPLSPAKSENKGFGEIQTALAALTGLILLFAEKRVPICRDRDESNSTGILTSSFNLTSSFPRFWRSGLWKFVARYSGATVPDFHGVPRHRNAIFKPLFLRLIQRTDLS